jgi:hypothetical protein
MLSEPCQRIAAPLAILTVVLHSCGGCQNTAACTHFCMRLGASFCASFFCAVPRSAPSKLPLLQQSVHLTLPPWLSTSHDRIQPFIRRSVENLVRHVRSNSRSGERRPAPPPRTARTNEQSSSAHAVSPRAMASVSVSQTTATPRSSNPASVVHSPLPLPLLPIIASEYGDIPCARTRLRHDSNSFALQALRTKRLMSEWL